MKGHASDCAVHNEPALPKGPCDCGFDSFAVSLRDTFAGLVLNGLLSDRDTILHYSHMRLQNYRSYSTDAEFFAFNAYKLADAMLEARDKK